MLKPLLLSFVLAAALPAIAQNAFVVIEDNVPRIVKEVRLGFPQIEVDGKLRGSPAQTSTLAKATLYRPGFVTLSHFDVGIHYVEDLGTGGSFNYELRIRGTAKSDTDFTRCFMVLELTAWRDKGVVWAEMPDLKAGQTVTLDLNFRLQVPIQEGTYIMHLFSGGIELLHSKMPAQYVAAQKKKTEEILAKRKRDFPAILAQAVAPVYPPEFNGTGLHGKARCVAASLPTGSWPRPS